MEKLKVFTAKLKVFTAKLKVFTAFSGYDSQCMALDRIGIDYDLVGWSEIDRYAIQAHNALLPEYETIQELNDDENTITI